MPLYIPPQPCVNRLNFDHMEARQPHDTRTGQDDERGHREQAQPLTNRDSRDSQRWLLGRSQRIYLQRRAVKVGRTQIFHKGELCNVLSNIYRDILCLAPCIIQVDSPSEARQ